LVADLRDTVREIPEGLRALTALAKGAAEKRGDGAPTPAPDVLDDPALDRVIDVPSVIATVDTAVWDARAEELGGNSYALVAGVTARLAERLGRRRDSDGTVTLSIAGNGRTSVDDDRAQAMVFANAVIDPAEVTRDLSPARARIRAARDQAKGQPDPTSKLYPLVAWSPRRTAMAVVARLFSYADSLPSSCSNLGEIPGYFANLDGTAAEYVVARAVDKNVTLRDLHRSHGTLVVVSGRINGRIWISVEAYELGAENSRSHLRSIIEGTLSEFGVDGATYL
jgi:hypothetical protein